MSFLGGFVLQVWNWFFCKPRVEKWHSTEKSFSKRWEKIICNERNSRSAVTICWMEPNKFNFTIFTPHTPPPTTTLTNFEILYLLVMQFIIHLKFFLKSWSKSNYLSNDTQISVYHRHEHLTVRKNLPGHYFRPCRITIHWENKR